MKRRALLAGSIGFLAAPLASQGQPAGKVSRIGFLSAQTAPPLQAALTVFKQTLRALGHVEGQNLVIEHRWAEGRYERLAALAQALVRLHVDLIVVPDGVPGALAAKAATKTIPIVFFAGDAVESGLVSSLARPGGNLTGVSGLTAGLDSKRLEILKEAIPGATHVAVLWNPENLTGVPQRNRMALAAETLGVKPHMVDVRSPTELDPAFANVMRDRPDALLVLADPMLAGQRKRIADVAVRARLPMVAQFRTFTESGGLLSYGANLLDVFRQLAVYADKIVKGAKPADLPVEQTTKYELVINAKTAKALGLTIPPSVLARADEVIQ